MIETNYIEISENVYLNEKYKDLDKVYDDDTEIRLYSEFDWKCIGDNGEEISGLNGDEMCENCFGGSIREVINERVEMMLDWIGIQGREEFGDYCYDIEYTVFVERIEIL